MDQRMKFSPGNPHGVSRYGFAWQAVPPGPAHLDFGCHDGAFLDSLSSKAVDRLVGLDLSRAAVAQCA